MKFLLSHVNYKTTKNILFTCTFLYSGKVADAKTNIRMREGVPQEAPQKMMELGKNGRK